MSKSDPSTPYQLDNSFDRRAMATPEGRRKAHLLAAITPADCGSILDAGGGTGWSTVGLREGRRVVTLDSCAESLAHAPGETVLAGVDDLPFEDGAFDMVLSSQVLEHLPGEVLTRAAGEMTRVARRYLLVSVPYREALKTRFVRCPGCGCAFHPDHHCNAFTETRLASLFPGWIMAEWHVFGPLTWALGVDPLRPPRLRRPKAELPPAPSATVCPACGTRGRDGAPAHDVPPSLQRRAARALKARLGRAFPALAREPYATFLPQNLAPYWIAGLFVREGAAPLDAPAGPR